MANVLTIIRIIGIFPLFISLMNNGPTIYNFILFAFLGFTDFLDGYIARKYNQVTSFGKIADGIADKLLMLFYHHFQCLFQLNNVFYLQQLQIYH